MIVRAVFHHWRGSHFSDGRGAVPRPLHMAEAKSACSATAKRKTMLLMARKAVSKAKQDAFEHICGKLRTVVKQLSDRQRDYAQRLPTCPTEQYPE